MSKCKSCLHYKVCDYRIDEENMTVAGCTQFTNRSEWVHLLCKAGDKVYQTDGIRLYESTIGKIDISSINIVYCTENIAFDERAIGKTVFLAREEAEKALEEKI